jgi:transcriptional regulator with XRE-family HTH domain
MDGKTFRSRRSAEGISGRAVCNRAGVPRPRLSEIENGHVTPTPDEVNRISGAINDLINTKHRVERIAGEHGLRLTGVRL